MKATPGSTALGIKHKKTLTIFSVRVKDNKILDGCLYTTLTFLLAHGLVSEEVAKELDRVLTHRWKREEALQHL